MLQLLFEIVNIVNYTEICNTQLRMNYASFMFSY